MELDKVINKATAIKLYCPEGRLDGMQMWLTHQEISTEMCVLITGPNEVHLIEKTSCHICPSVINTYMMPILSEFFRPLSQCFRTRQYDFFQKHAYNFREEHLKYLTIPLVSRHSVTYLGISHISNQAIADLFQMTIQNFCIDCENNKLCINVDVDPNGTCCSDLDDCAVVTRKRKKV